MKQASLTGSKPNIFLAVFIFLILFLFAGLLMYLFLSKHGSNQSEVIVGTLSPKAEEGKELLFETLLVEKNSNYAERENYIIKNGQEWENLLSKIKIDEIISTSFLNVDFSDEMLAAVFQGEKNSGGYGINIYKITEDKKDINVFVEEVSPGPDCITTAEITQPYHIVKFKKTGKNIKFIPKSEVVSCNKTAKCDVNYEENLEVKGLINAKSPVLEIMKSACESDIECEWNVINGEIGSKYYVCCPKDIEDTNENRKTYEKCFVQL